MTRDRWDFHGKEIFLHKAAVTHRHLKPMDFQLVVFSQANLQERKCTLQHAGADRPRRASVHHLRCRRCGTVKLLLPPEVRNEDETATAKPCWEVFASSRNSKKNGKSLSVSLLF